MANSDFAMAKALEAMALWVNGDRANAISQASRIPTDSKSGAVFSRLHDLMRQADQPTAPPQGDKVLELLLPESSGAAPGRAAVSK